jgi:hypothetical protein
VPPIRIDGRIKVQTFRLGQASSGVGKTGKNSQTRHSAELPKPVAEDRRNMPQFRPFPERGSNGEGGWKTDLWLPRRGENAVRGPRAPVERISGMDNATPIRRVGPPAPRLGNDAAAGDLKRLHLTGGIAGLTKKFLCHWIRARRRRRLCPDDRNPGGNHPAWVDGAPNGDPAPSKHLAGSVALVGQQAPDTGARATMTRDLGVGRWDGLPGQPLPPQLLHAGTDCREIVSCSGP